MGLGLGLGLGSFGGGLISAIGNAVSAKKQNEANLQMQREQNEYNLQMWNLENEYNSPEAQMERYKQAGLNPNLIYGSATNQHSNAPMSVPRQNVPIPYGNIGEAISQGFNATMQALTMQKSLEEADSRIASNKANVEFKDAQKNNLLLQQVWNAARNKAGEATDYWGQRFASEIFKNNYTLERTRNLQLQSAFLPQLYTAKLKNLNSLTALNGKQLFVDDAKIRNLDSSTYLNYSSAHLNQAKKEGQEIINDLDRYLSNFKKEGASVELESKYEQLYQTRQNIELLKQKDDQAEKDNNYYEAKLIWSMISDILKVVK